MARKAEEGIDYFPINTDMVHNNKVKLVVAEFGPKSWAVVVPLFCKIYREKGYWIDWHNEEMKLLFAQDDCKCELSFVNEVATGCIRRGIFDKSVFDMFGVLTSDRIQENFLEAKKRNKEVRLIEEFLLLDENSYNINENVNIITLNVDILTKDVSKSAQKRIEKNKKEKTIEELQKENYKSLEKNKVSVAGFIKKEKPKFIAPFVDLWNLFASERKKSKVKTLTDMRLKKFNVRINEPDFDFLAIISKAKNSEFLMTRSFFTFDWIIENQDNYVQILEGKYDNNLKPEQHVNGLSETEKHKQEFERAAQKQREILASD